ncbi:MAG: alpha-amylase family glycosyl hydrolase [Bacteroidota bacterium]
MMFKTAKLNRLILLLLLAATAGSCTQSDNRGTEVAEAPFVWENANIYFLLTDRFMNGDPTNDINFDRTEQTAVMRGFQGGDMTGVIQKIEEGYFDKLGVTALWMTPWFEQIQGSTDEGTGVTYAYHGYWISDWTSVDPNFGTPDQLAQLVETAHAHDIRIVMDVVINHTGPVTGKDPVWPDEWVRTAPPCTYRDYESTITCTLVENLPDIRTESDQQVDLPPALLEKWEREGRLEKELEELDAFFSRTGYPRAPRYYMIKWLTDFIRKYGIDGYRLDTAKHIEEGVWKELYDEAMEAFREWKEQNPERVLDDNEFYMVGEVYNYGIGTGRMFDFGDRRVDFYAQSLHSLINFDFKYNATGAYEELFSSYSQTLHNELKGKGVLNYLTSHDDGTPYDKERVKPIEAATKLLLTPGSCQIYYGDESCRNLVIPEANGDATLRGAMNWDEIENNSSRNGFVIGEVMEHYRKLGQFRRDHPAVGAGLHAMVSEAPYIFTRSFKMGDYSDKVVVGLDLDRGKKAVVVGNAFKDQTALYDYYSDTTVSVKDGMVVIDSPWEMVLLGQK